MEVSALASEAELGHSAVRSSESAVPFTTRMSNLAVDSRSTDPRIHR